MTPPINSVSDHILQGIAAGDLAASPFEVVSIAKELAARRAANTPVDGWVFDLKPMDSAPSGDEALEPDELNVHEGAWAIVYGTNAKPIGWIDTHATFAHRVYRDRVIASPALPSQVVGAALTAYELQVLLGTSISGCNMEADRTFDLPAAWARLKALGLIDRADGLAIATDKGLARIQACLTSPAAEPVAWLFEYIAGDHKGDIEVHSRDGAETPETTRVQAQGWAGKPFPVYTRSSASREVTATHRHVKRGTEYVLIGIGKMQAEKWLDQIEPANATGFAFAGNALASVDMREVAIYRSVDDGSLSVRPREEFEDGRFEALLAALPEREG